MGNTNAMANAATQELMTEDISFMDAMAGDGFEGMTGNAVSTAYLGLVQPDSGVESDECPAGTWRNSATGRSYGTDVNVVVLDFRMIWNERESDPPFRTVGRYPVKGIEVEVRQPPKGKKGYPKLINPESGNEIQELFVYAVVLPDYPEDGILFFMPTVGSMRTAKAWNSMLFSQRLPSGKQAPIFGMCWTLTASLVQNPQQPSKQITKFVKATRSSIVNKELFTETVQPALVTAKESAAAITSSTDDVEE